MDKDISLEVLKCQQNESGSDPDGISSNKDTVPEEEIENDQVEDNKGVVSIRYLKVYLTCIYFCLDVMLYLHEELDEKSLVDKITHIWTDWYLSRKDNKFKKSRNSKGSTAKDIFFLIVRCKKLLSCLSFMIYVVFSAFGI